jgi:uncharacterized membrane protein (UPF0127 family)
VNPGRKDRVVRLVREDGRVVCDRCAVAETPLRRMRGLLGRHELEPGEGLLIRPASSIHMFFMRFPIDAVFLDRQVVVRKVVPGLRPWRVAFARGAKSVVELSAGETERRGVSVGARLALEAVDH